MELVAHVDTRPALLVSRAGGDWQCLCGGQDESEEVPHVVGLNHLIERDPTLAELRPLPEEWEVERTSVGGSIVNRFDWDAVRAAIKSVCDTVPETAGPWEVVAEHLASFGAWEFEDYQEEPEEPQGPKTGVRLELKDLQSPDLPQGPSEPPPDPADRCIAVSAGIGQAGLGPIERFRFTITTPTDLSRRLEPAGWQLGRHLIILNQFEWGTVRLAVQSICHKVSQEAETWDDAVRRVARYGMREIHDRQKDRAEQKGDRFI